MHQLFKYFLEAHQHATAHGSTLSFNSALDQEALKLYTQASMEAHRRARNRQIDVQRLLVNALAVRLTQLLSTVNLRDLTSYNTMKQAIEYWCPWQGSQQSSCLILQQTLLEMLPAARQKQELEFLCHQYSAHLKTEIETAIKTEKQPVYLEQFHAKPKLFGAPPLPNIKQNVSIVRDQRGAIDQIAAEPQQYLSNPSESLTSALKKYQVVNELQQNLKNPVKTAITQVADFNDQFQAKREVLEKNRDSLSITFMKAVATVLTVGFAIFCGIWNVHGKISAKQIQQTRDPEVLS
jgi:hypothetical protein